MDIFKQLFYDQHLALWSGGRNNEPKLVPVFVKVMVTAEIEKSWEINVWTLSRSWFNVAPFSQVTWVKPRLTKVLLCLTCGFPSSPVLACSWRVHVLSHFSRVQLFETLWTVAHQAPLSMGFSRQEYWSGLPHPPPGDLPDSGIEPVSPALAGSYFTSSATWGAHTVGRQREKTELWENIHSF